MPKRKNPFGENTPLQCKTHVGFEQVATAEERQAVFERTKALLFQGANRISNGASAVPPSAPVRDYHNGSDHCSSLHCQLVGNGHSEMALTRVRQQTGLLVYFTSSGGATGSGGGKLRALGGGGGRECSGCKGQQREVWSCGHCERGVCAECGRQCWHCQATFCSSCSVLNYDETQLRSFCLNCLSR